VSYKGLSDSKEHPRIFFTPTWVANELCAQVAKCLQENRGIGKPIGLLCTAADKLCGSPHHFSFRKVLGAFESGSFSFWFKSLVLFGPGELKNKLLFCPSAIKKLVGELNTGDLHEDLYCIETDVDSTIVGSPELDKLARLA
jgi:integrator complex subunit 7